MKGDGQRGDRDETQASWPDAHWEINTTSPFHPAPLPHLYLSLLTTVSFSPSQIGFIHNLFFNVLFFFPCICSVALNGDAPAKSKYQTIHVVMLLSYDSAHAVDRLSEIISTLLPSPLISNKPLNFKTVHYLRQCCKCKRSKKNLVRLHVSEMSKLIFRLNAY